MKSLFPCIGLILIVCAVRCASSSFENPKSLPNVDQILDKYVQAIGGKGAWLKLTSRQTKGTLEIKATGTAVASQIYQKAPNKRLSQLEIPGLGTVREGFDGAVAWTQAPRAGISEIKGTQLAEIKLDADFYRELRLKELYPKILLKSIQKVGGRDAYMLEAVAKEGKPSRFYFDAENGLLVRVELDRQSAMGETHQDIYFEDHQVVDGVKLPFTIRQTEPARAAFLLKVSEIKHNVAINDARFSKPKSE
jgi:zinc protease